MPKNNKARIFIENGTNLSFDLRDIDNNHFANINPVSQYSILLNVNSNGEKQYNLIYGINTASFWLNINGEISRVMNNSDIDLEVIVSPNKTLAVQNSQNVNLYVKKLNHLLITPASNPTARSVPQFFISPIDEIFKLDFTDRS